MFSSAIITVRRGYGRCGNGRNSGNERKGGGRREAEDTVDQEKRRNVGGKRMNMRGLVLFWI